MNKKLFSIIFFLVILVLFFKSFFFQFKLPIPSDTIIGLYHPFRDFYAKEYPNGIPFKNFLITDPVRQQYPWRNLTIDIEKKLNLPLWNPYSMSGTPLLANFQSAVFYPLNIIFFFLPFNFSWSLLIVLQPLLASVFLYFYLINLKLNRYSSFLGGLVFGFCGFFVAWMEWGTIGNVAIWLPLILLSIDKLFNLLNLQLSNMQARNKKVFFWMFVFIFSFMSSFFAGHLQIFFYLFIVSTCYLLARWIQFGKNLKSLILFFISYILFFILTSVQWLPTFQFILQSARDVDQIGWENPGWFIPWNHLIQFIAPDFFGNPTTLNYWGTWNYGEFIGYIGILPLLFSIFALFFRHDRKTLFFGTALFLSLIFSLPTIFAKIPYFLKVPLLSTSQPTRLILIMDFSLAVLTALGFDYFLKQRKKMIILIIATLIVFVGMWVFVFFGNIFNLSSRENLLVTRHNLILPTIIFVVSSFLLVTFIKSKKVLIFLPPLIIALVAFDLLRFGLKFTPFTPANYLFPKTSSISYLTSKKDYFRIMAVDERIFPPNFSVVYKLQSVDGYDPLYLRRYGELIAASERNSANISEPFGFNRIITPKNFDSKIIDLIGVKYVLSLSELRSKKLEKVFQEGQTIIYENKNVLPRAFFVETTYSASNKNDAIQTLFKDEFIPNKIAVVENFEQKQGFSTWSVGDAEFLNYSENRILISTNNKGKGFLVLTDSFYPVWHVKIDNLESNIYRTDYNFRGVIVPQGKHNVEFYSKLF